MPKPIVEFQDVCFAYSGGEVLHNVNFTVSEREMVAVVGPNGGGKTTLLRLMLGFLQPRLGTVRVFGAVPKTIRARIGYVPQHMMFDPQFPVNALDVVRMGRVDRHWSGWCGKSDRQAAELALEQVGMQDLSRRGFRELSGGERQRVLIALALASEPDLLLMDEPTANVDALVEHKLYELLRELHKSLTIVIVSHNLNVVTAHVSHVACVNRVVGYHTVEHITAKIVQEAYGGDLAVLRHGAECQIIDASAAMHSPHHGECQHHEHDN